MSERQMREETVVHQIATYAQLWLDRIAMDVYPGQSDSLGSPTSDMSNRWAARSTSGFRRENDPSPRLDVAEI